MNLNQMWGLNLLTALRHVADERYQRRAWFGIGPEVSSPTEVFNELFDDCRISEFIRRPDALISSDTKEELVKLEELLAWPTVQGRSQ